VLGRCFAEVLEGMLSVDLVGSILFVEFAKAVGDWLRGNGMIGGVPKAWLGYSGSLVVGRMKDMMKNIDGDEVGAAAPLVGEGSQRHAAIL
jgi:hypothetical protein